jgi:hypothetical protein
MIELRRFESRPKCPSRRTTRDLPVLLFRQLFVPTATAIQLRLPNGANEKSDAVLQLIICPVTG